jgi:hypothetical protein
LNFVTNQTDTEVEEQDPEQGQKIGRGFCWGIYVDGSGNLNLTEEENIL